MPEGPPTVSDIELRAGRLQRLATGGLWAVADSSLLQAFARGVPMEFGPRGKQLRALIGAVAKVRLEYPLLFVVGLRELAGLLVRQRGERKATDQAPDSEEPGPRSPPPYFFVGFGAGPEEVMYARYRSEHAGDVGRLDQIDPSTFGVWHKVGLADALRALVGARKSAEAVISNLPVEFCGRRLDFLTFAGIRIAHYAFTRAWFEGLRRRGTRLREVAFLAADTPAFAAVDAGVPTRYIQHGMIRQSLVLPGFAKIDALTRDEAKHFRHRLPAAEVTLRTLTEPRLAPDAMSRGILIASVYGLPAEMPRVVGLIEWASSKGLQVWVRPHPREDRAFWGRDEVRTSIEIEDRDPSFPEAIVRLRPRLVVSWFSTALADSLALGVIPVSVSAMDNPDVLDMVYPLFDRCLRWPDDAAKLERLFSDDQAYTVVLAQLERGRREGSA